MGKVIAAWRNLRIAWGFASVCRHGSVKNAGQRLSVLLILFSVGCSHNVPTPPPTLHGAVITIQESGPWASFIVYRGTTCTSTMAIATIKTLSYRDTTVPAGPACYGVAAVSFAGGSSRSVFIPVMIPKNGVAQVKFGASKTEPAYAR